MSSLSVRNAIQLLRPPEDGLSYLRHDRAQNMNLDGEALTINDGQIVSFEHDSSADAQIDASGCAIIPGLIDAHTHLPFAGWREGEYAQRIAGYSYEEIARDGGGITASARAFRESTDGQILKQAEVLAHEMLRHGTTTFECKSGYGLSIEGELRALELASKLGQVVKQRTSSTALLAHALPPGMEANQWLKQIKGALPKVKANRSAQALDIYVESIAFTNDHLASMGEFAQEFDLALRCHVEQFATHRSVPVALAAGARSVDHLACMHYDDLPALASSECAAVLLPGAEFLGDERCARGRELAHAGAICVLATDLNPGTSPVTSLPLIIGLAVRRYGWTAKEALLAVTLNAAWVLSLSDQIGSLEVGKRGDFLLIDGPVERIPYRFGHNPVVACFIDGQPTFIRPDAVDRFQ